MNCIFEDDILVFRDELKYTLDETINELKFLCSIEEIKQVYLNNQIRLVSLTSLLN